MPVERRERESRERAIERILARRRARRLERSYARAPDEFHGNCRIDAIYDRFGCEWTTSTLFAATIPGLSGADGDGGWTVGRYDDRFLEIEQGIRGEVDDPEAWLAMRRADSKRLVVLEIPAANHGSSVGSEEAVWTVKCRRRRLLELERSELDAARDRTFGGGRGSGPSREARLLQSRIDLVSFICLMARLE